MSGYRRRPYLTADVPPLACLVLLREFGPAMERYAAAMEQSALPGKQEAGAEVREALASMRETVAWWQSRRGSDGGTSEPATESADAPSTRFVVVEPAEPESCWMTAQQVATELQVSESYVTRLCRNVGLRGHRRGRVWLVDPESVREFQARRSVG